MTNAKREERQFLAGPPREKLAPSGGSDGHASAERGGRFLAGPPREKLAPSGGSDGHASAGRGG